MDEIGPIIINVKFHKGNKMFHKKIYFKCLLESKTCGMAEIGPIIINVKFHKGNKIYFKCLLESLKTAVTFQKF